MNESMPKGPTGDEMVNESEAEMSKRLQAMVAKPDFFDTHVINPQGYIVPKGEEWDAR